MEKKVYAALAEYKDKYGEPFLFDGVDYLEILVCIGPCARSRPTTPPPPPKRSTVILLEIPQKHEIESRSLNAEIFGIKAGSSEGCEGMANQLWGCRFRYPTHDPSLCFFFLQ
jgi:hypothetical protein